MLHVKDNILSATLPKSEISSGKKLKNHELLTGPTEIFIFRTKFFYSKFYFGVMAN